MFVLSCKFDSQNPIIYDCIKSIKHYMPDEKIAVAFSEPPDNFNPDILKSIDIILTFDNKHYCEGALWKAYEKYPEEEFFYWIHDSIILQSSLIDFKKNEVTCIRWFSVNQLDSTKGFGSFDNLNWASFEYRIKCNKDLIFNYKGVFGPMLLINKKTLDKVNDTGFSKILPNNKDQAVAMERLWGIVLFDLGIDVSSKSIQGQHISHFGPYDETILCKKYLNRF